MKDLRYYQANFFKNLKGKITTLVPNIHFKGIAFLVLVWIFFWITPWTVWLDSLPWVRLGTGLLLFMTPGIVISILLAGARFSLPQHFISGIAFSVLIVSILGLLGRLLHLPFDLIKLVFALTGLIILLWLLIYSQSESQLYESNILSLTTIFFLTFMIAFGIIINLLSRTTGDDQTYLAYLTSWQNANPLNLQEVFFGSGNIDSIRFWLSMFPMSLALLAEISNIHGLLLIGFYLEPFLIVIAILATYILYERLLISERMAIPAVLLQFTFLFLLRGHQQPGLTFFNRLSEDKVFGAFILFPVFFLATCLLLERFNLRSAIYFMLVGVSLAFTHPVILAFGTFVIGLHAGIVVFQEREYRKGVIIILLLMTIIFPVGSLRYIEVSSASSIPYDLESALEIGAGIETRISYLEGTPFYGFNWDRIQVGTDDNRPKSLIWSFLSYSYLWIAGLGFLWSIVKISKNPTAPFITATSSLVLLSAIPYTGWLIGYFVSARMLWRTPWLVPIGLIGAVLLSQFFSWIISRAPASKYSTDKLSHILVAGISSILILFFSIFAYREDWKALAEIQDYYSTLENLTALGIYLEDHIEQPSVFVAAAQSSNDLNGLFTQSLMDYLPGLSSKSKVLIFRWYRSSYLVSEDKLRLLFSPDTAIKDRQRINIIKQNQIEYVLLDNPSIIEYYASKPDFFDVQIFRSYGILKLNGNLP